MNIDITNVDKIARRHDCNVEQCRHEEMHKCINLSLYFSQRNHRDPWVYPIEDQKSASGLFPPHLASRGRPRARRHKQE